MIKLCRHVFCNSKVESKLNCGRTKPEVLVTKHLPPSSVTDLKKLYSTDESTLTYKQYTYKHIHTHMHTYIHIHTCMHPYIHSWLVNVTETWSHPFAWHSSACGCILTKVPARLSPATCVSHSSQQLLLRTRGDPPPSSNTVSSITPRVLYLRAFEIF
jgi:hypothetical protein